MRFSLMLVVSITIVFAIFKGMYFANTGISAVAFPTFSAPTVTFRAIPSDCSGFTDALFCIAEGIFNFVLGIIFVVELIVVLVVYIVQLFLFLVVNSFSGIPGAPGVINAILILPFGFTVGMVFYKLIRSGDGDSTEA